MPSDNASLLRTANASLKKPPQCHLYARASIALIIELLASIAQFRIETLLFLLYLVSRHRYGDGGG